MDQITQSNLVNGRPDLRDWLTNKCLSQEEELISRPHRDNLDQPIRPRVQNWEGPRLVIPQFQSNNNGVPTQGCCEANQIYGNKY